MKTLRNLVLYAVPALLLAAIPATLLAAPHGPGRGPGPGFGPGHGPFGGLMGELIAERLDLTEDQRAEIRAIRESYRDEAEELTETLQVAQLVLRGRIHSDLFDETAIREAAGQVGAVQADLAVLRAKIASDVHQVLTPEQLEEARAMRGRMHELAGEWHGRGRGHWGRGGFDAPPSDGE